MKIIEYRASGPELSIARKPPDIITLHQTQPAESCQQIRLWRLAETSNHYVLIDSGRSHSHPGSGVDALWSILTQ